CGSRMVAPSQNCSRPRYWLGRSWKGSETSPAHRSHLRADFTLKDYELNPIGGVIKSASNSAQILRSKPYFLVFRASFLLCAFAIFASLSEILWLRPRFPDSSTCGVGGREVPLF